MSWAENAACAGLDPEGFYPDPSDEKGTQAALRVCHGCPVRTQCLNAAIDRRDINGVWGGTTEAQRKYMIRKLRERNREAARTPVE